MQNSRSGRNGFVEFEHRAELEAKKTKSPQDQAAALTKVQECLKYVRSTPEHRNAGHMDETF